ncbi:hypothetical protein ABB37_06139 [Leptomonas pyrrhocoris]|uniref:Uncharacterized protein n=1 Tax=Leptomonas pyrrhocoris TaxID=157538 RepID=A0A0M9FYF4_LEPPY|nr:hypothetical protein ABB37_06139 [Leptomonas pyrrhocoris]KPA78533.1 hypothetical protein ABB37_06139 [Leptomonas pyrrhocoris]|eukprot:XP_015656972.1 hypothetical protein ABB37_06139 [Leptomonas pyrrhocoris]
MNPHYAEAPPPPQQQQQRPKVDLDDLFGGVSSPAPSANANNGSGYADAAGAPPPSYDALGGNGYGAHPAASNEVYAAQPPPPPPLPQQQQQQQQQGYYGVPPSLPSMQSYAPGTAPGPQPVHPSYNASSAAYGMNPALQQQQHQQQQQLAYNGAAAGAAVAVPQVPPSPQVYLPQLQPSVSSHPSSPGSPPAAPAAAPAVEEDERAQLDRIIRLRRELEQEQEREQRKKDELQTWGCTVCTFRNKLGVVKCEMCGSTRPGYAAPTTPSPSSSSVAAAPPAQPTAAATQPSRAGVTAWQCGMCLAPNDASAERCKVCYAYRSSGTPVPTTVSKAGSGSGGGMGVASNTPFTTRWKCSVCGEVNAPSDAHCKICHGFQRNGTPVMEEGGGPSAAIGGHNNTNGSGGDPPPPTSWACSVCTFENPISAAVCTACESGQRPRHLAPKRDEKKAHASSKQHGGESEKKTGDDKKAAKQWPCPTCTFHNPMGRKKCDMCGAKRPEKYASAADTAEARAEASREAQDDEGEVAWQDDDSVTECNNCHTTFTFLTRRHHCRLCGYVFCAHCSSYMLNLTEGGFPQRVCLNCYKARKEEEKKVVKGRKWLAN